jgi:F-type H+-transporting ATPase subunit b
MEALLASLGGLLLRALPTVIILLLLHSYLRATFFKPLEKALRERKAATTGTRKIADETLRKAEQKAAEYEEKMRAARADIYREQEQHRRRWRDEQTTALAAMKEQVDAQIREERISIEAARQEAVAGLDAESERLAEQIATRVLVGSSA